MVFGQLSLLARPLYLKEAWWTSLTGLRRCYDHAVQHGVVVHGVVVPGGMGGADHCGSPWYGSGYHISLGFKAFLVKTGTFREFLTFLTFWQVLHESARFCTSRPSVAQCRPSVGPVSAKCDPVSAKCDPVSAKCDPVWSSVVRWVKTDISVKTASESPCL